MKEHMLVTVSLSSKNLPLPADALSAIDAALAANGLRKQVRSVVIPGKEYTTTYDGPMIDKRKIEEIVTPIAEVHHFTFAVDIEESVTFP